MRPALLALLALAVSRAPADAQSCEQTGTGSCAISVSLAAAIPFAAQLTVSSASTAFGTIGPSTLAAGSTSGTLSATGPTISAIANFGYAVTLKAAASAWSYTGTSTDPAKPVSDLRFRLVTTGPFTTLTTGGTQILSGSAGTSSSTATFLQSLWNWTTNPPGTYSLPLSVTLTAP